MSEERDYGDEQPDPWEELARFQPRPEDLAFEALADASEPHLAEEAALRAIQDIQRFGGFARKGE